MDTSVLCARYHAHSSKVKDRTDAPQIRDAVLIKTNHVTLVLNGTEIHVQRHQHVVIVIRVAQMSAQIERSRFPAIQCSFVSDANFGFQLKTI